MHRTWPQRTAWMPSADRPFMMTLAYLLGVSTWPVWHQTAARRSSVRLLSCRKHFTTFRMIAVLVPASVCAWLWWAWNWLLHAVVACSCRFAMRTQNGSVVSVPGSALALLLVLVVCFS